MMARRCARKLERGCCLAATYSPLVFIYGLTSWGLWVVIEIGKASPKKSWLGNGSSLIAIILYSLANWSYTTAVFTDPGSTTNDDGYGLLPTTQTQQPAATSFTVKSNGELRFCKKCQARKPDRAHHCSTCRRCVLKMDHHCPWLATCLGLHNYKAFLLFLTYATLACFYAFAVSSMWVWSEVVEEDTKQLDALLPVNFIVLSVMTGIIGIVIGAFTGWHIMLACKGQTTIECLEKTRYLSPLKQPYRQAHNPANNVPQAAQQFVDFHTNALPGITRPEEGEERRHPSGTPFDSSMSLQQSFEERERQQSRLRYEEYLDEQDSSKLPHAFDLGWKLNLRHVLGPNPWLWAFPICNTTGDGWTWEASPRWLEARDRLRREREEQRAREINAGWGHPDAGPPTDGAGFQPSAFAPSANGAPRRAPSKADRILGRDPNLYADASPQGLQMNRLNNRGRTLEDDMLDTDEEGDIGGVDTSETAGLVQNSKRDDDAEQRALNVVTNGRGWGRGGASGMLRKQSSQSSRAQSPQVQDEGVD